VHPLTGAITTFVTNAGLASDLAFAPDGTLYISGGASVRRVTAGGTVTVFASGLMYADGITITPDGARMFVADSGTDTIRQITIPGGVMTTFASADIDDGFAVSGIVAAPGNTLITMTGETALTVRGFVY
jgi:sugar lactone lactonase YvrE